MVFGTRPEAIKLAPLVRELRSHSQMQPVVCVTGQHSEMLCQVLEAFDITPDFDLGIMAPNQTLSYITQSVLTKLEPIIDHSTPTIVIVQGDTTTAMAASLSAYYQQVPVGHVEAGLRTDDKFNPFPEEINRRVVDVIADLHFAPTELAKRNLLNERVDPKSIYLTGNTVIDALLLTVRSITGGSQDWDESANAPDDIPTPLANLLRPGHGKRMILVTGHRRESFGRTFSGICHALKTLVTRNPDVIIVYPVHMNPNVLGPVYEILGNVERVHLIDPPSYPGFVWLMCKSHMILTDSGGVQEEAPSLGKPVLVMRNVTERPEGVDAGCAKVVGVSSQGIVRETERLLNDRDEHTRMSLSKNPYGDGHSSPRIVEAIAQWATDL